MTNYEMTEKLSEKMGVTMEEAKTALEACEWDMLDAALLLEKEHGSGQAPYTTRPEGAADGARTEHDGGKLLPRIGRLLKKLLEMGSRNRFEVRRKGEDAPVLDMPVLVMAALLLFAFWVCIPLLIIGLFAGFHYSFSGAELGRETINSAMDKASEAADRVMEEIRKKD